MPLQNINESETLTMFCYNTWDLKPNSEKPVVWYCKTCDKMEIKKYRAAKLTTNCLKCSNKVNANVNKEQMIASLKKWYSENENPKKGIPRPPHVHAALAAAKYKVIAYQKSDESRLKRSIANTGSGNPFYGKKHSPETIAKMCEIQKSMTHSKGENSNFYGKRPFHGKGCWYTTTQKEMVWLRSSWEVKFAEYLDLNGIEWKYEHNTFPIEYSGKKGTYCPDFFLVAEQKYIEVKGWWRDDAEEKYKAFTEQYPNIIIEVYDKKALKKLDIKL